MGEPLPHTFRVGGWRVQPSLNQLVREDEPTDVVRVEPKAMEVLVYLARHAGDVVDKESVVRDVWQGAFVTNEVLTNAVWELRRALGDDAKSSQFIQTIPKRGYRLVAPVLFHDEPTEKPRRHRALLRLLPVAVALAAAALLVRLWPSPEKKAVTRFAVDLPEPLASFFLPAVAISPNGSAIVYAAGGSGLRLRPLDRMESTPIAGTVGAHGPFFSPDGSSLGFYSRDGRLHKVKLGDGSTPVALARLGAPRGASWGSDGFIYFTSGSNGGLFRVREEGGEPEALTQLDDATSEWTHRWPEVLPRANAVLFTAAHKDMTSFDEAEIDALDLKTRQRKVIVERGSFSRYVDGYLLFARGGQILSVPFDPDQVTTLGPARVVLEDVRLYPIDGSAQISLSRNGCLAYVPKAQESEVRHRLMWASRDGSRTPILEDARVLYDPALSPDGSRLAVSIVTEGNSDLWVFDLGRRTLSRLTTSGGEEEHPLFTPDGRGLAYDYSMAGPFRILSRPIDGAPPEQELTGASYSERPESYSPDGKWLVFSQQNLKTGFDLWKLELDGERKRVPLLASTFDERYGRVSPDGRFLAYSSNESGRFEVYVTTFPEPGARIQVSAEGGENPVWTHKGHEIIYRAGDAMMSVAIATYPELSAGKAEKLFPWTAAPPLLEGAYRNEFDVSPDGSRLLLAESGDDPSSRRIHVVLNWVEELNGARKGAEPK